MIDENETLPLSGTCHWCGTSAENYGMPFIFVKNVQSDDGGIWFCDRGDCLSRTTMFRGENFHAWALKCLAVEEWTSNGLNPRLFSKT